MAKLSEVEGLDEALASARADGVAEGKVQGYASGRADAAAILGAEGAAGNIDLAVELAADPAISVDRGKSLIGRAKASSGGFQQLLVERSPDVGANVPSNPTGDDAAKMEARRAQIRANAQAATGLKAKS